MIRLTDIRGNPVWVGEVVVLSHERKAVSRIDEISGSRVTYPGGSMFVRESPQEVLRAVDMHEEDRERRRCQLVDNFSAG